MTNLLSILKKLPKHAFIDNQVGQGARRFPDCDAPVINVTRGIEGYEPIYTPLNANELNESIGVTEAQKAAMLHGSMFGFHTSGSDPDNYDERGLFSAPKIIQPKSLRSKELEINE